MKDEYFDKLLKCELKNSIKETTPSKDIFEEAWNKSKEISNRENSKNLYIMNICMNKKIIAAIILGLIISVAALSFEVSPSVRAAVKVIFGIDDDGNIVEESEEDIGGVNSVMAVVNESNRGVLEELLGFKIEFPDMVGNYTSATFDDWVCIYVKGCKNKEEGNISYRIKSATDYNELYEDLREKYDVKFNVIHNYYNKINLRQICLTQYYGDELKGSSAWKSKEVKDIENIECTIFERKVARGNEVVKRGEDGSITSIETDSTLKPTSVEKTVKIIFSYNGIVYDVSDSDENIEKALSNELEFTEEYIKMLKGNS